MKSALSFRLALNFILMASQVLGAALGFRNLEEGTKYETYAQRALRKMTQNLNFVLQRVLHYVLEKEF